MPRAMTITRELASARPSEGRPTRIRDYLDSRPPSPRPRRSRAAIELAPRPVAAALVHVSTGRGVRAGRRGARLRGSTSAARSTAHHLVLTTRTPSGWAPSPVRAAAAPGDRVPTLSGPGCATARRLVRRLRPLAVAAAAARRRRLLESGRNPRLPVDAELLLTDGRLTLPELTERVAGAVARRFSLPDKGSLEPGNDADLVLVTLGALGWTPTSCATAIASAVRRSR